MDPDGDDDRRAEGTSTRAPMPIGIRNIDWVNNEIIKTEKGSTQTPTIVVATSIVERQ